MAGTPTERFNPYSRSNIQRRVANETPSQIVKLLSRQPPTDSKFKEVVQSIGTRSVSTEYVMNQPEHHSPLRLSKASARFKNYNTSALEDQRQIHMFKKRDRHNELVDDTLSVITELTTDRYSRFDRLFQTMEEPHQQRMALFSSQRQEAFDQPNEMIPGKVNIEQTAPIFEETRSLQRQQQQTQESDRDTPMDIDSSFYEGGDGHVDALIENTQQSLFHDIRLATQETGYENTQKSLFHEIALATQEIPKRRELSSPQLQAQAQTQTQTQTNNQTQELPLQPPSQIASQIASHSSHSSSMSPPSASPPPISPVVETQEDTFEEDVRRAQEGMNDDDDYYGGGFEEDYDEGDLNQESNDIDEDFYGDDGVEGTGFNRFLDERLRSRTKNTAMFDGDDNNLSEPISSTEIRKPVEPRNKVVIQGDSFISKLMDKPPNLGHNAIPTVQVKSLFDSYLGFNKLITMPVNRYAHLRSLFFEQMLDDLKSYKESQPEDLQDEITPEDMILLMKRQKVITEKQSLEALSHKYLPKEYSDLVSQSALAYNRLYPAAVHSNVDDSFDDDVYDYDDE